MSSRELFFFLSPFFSYIFFSFKRQLYFNNTSQISLKCFLHKCLSLHLVWPSMLYLIAHFIHNICIVAYNLQVQSWYENNFKPTTTFSLGTFLHVASLAHPISCTWLYYYNYYKTVVAALGDLCKRLAVVQRAPNPPHSPRTSCKGRVVLSACSGVVVVVVVGDHLLSDTTRMWDSIARISDRATGSGPEVGARLRAPDDGISSESSGRDVPYSRL